MFINQIGREVLIYYQIYILANQMRVSHLKMVFGVVPLSFPQIRHFHFKYTENRLQLKSIIKVKLTLSPLVKD